MKQAKTEYADGFIKVGGLNTHYLVGGEGPPLILVAGAAATTGEAWADNLQSLASYYRIYALDLAGYGGSDIPEADYTLSFLITFLEGFVAALGLEKVSLMGHSLGGGLAIAFTLDHPDRVQKLILIDSAGVEDDTALLGRLLFPLFTLKAKLKRDKAYLSVMRSKDKSRKVYYNRLSEIKVPTLIIWARWDGYLSIK